MLLLRPSSLHNATSFSSERATSSKLCPSAASLRANTSPIPEDAPVIRVVFIEKRLRRRQALHCRIRDLRAPSGATGNSPAIYRWEKVTKIIPSPEGTKEV